MRLAPRPNDDQLLAPPDLGDGIESLDYWRRRSVQLPWYRIRARREAARMTVRWEQRVRAAVLAQRGVPIAMRLAGGLLVARTRLRRWTVRAAVAATTTVALATATVVAVLILLLGAF